MNYSIKICHVKLFQQEIKYRASKFKFLKNLLVKRNKIPYIKLIKIQNPKPIIIERKPMLLGFSK